MAKVIIIDGGPSLVDIQPFTFENCLKYMNHTPIPEEDKGGEDATDETIDYMNGNVIITLCDFDGCARYIVGSVEDFIK